MGANELLQAFLLFSLLFVASIIDIRKREIPNCICFAIALVGLLDFRPLNLLGVLVSCVFLIVALIFGGIGGGDIKLVASIGIVLGLTKSIIGAIAGILAMLLFDFLLQIYCKWQKAVPPKALPLAPFLSIGYLIAFFM